MGFQKQFNERIQIKVTRHIEELNASTKFFNNKFEEREQVDRKKEREISELTRDVETLNKKQNQWIGKTLDCHGQYSKRNSSRLLTKTLKN